MKLITNILKVPLVIILVVLLFITTTIEWVLSLFNASER